MSRLRDRPFVRRLDGVRREQGARAAARHLAARLGSQVYETERHLVVEKDLGEIAVPVRRGGVELAPLEPDHLPALARLNRQRDDVTGDRRFAGDLANGHAGFVALRDGRPIGFYWWADATMPPHRELRTVALGVTLGQRDVYGTDFYVDEDARRGGTAVDFLFQVETALAQRGFRHLWGTVDEVNRPARWTYATRGYEERWAVTGTRRLRRWRYRMEPRTA